MKIHKAMTEAQIKSFGYYGYFNRKLCNRREHLGYAGEKMRGGTTKWKRVTCKRCLRKKP